MQQRVTEGRKSHYGYNVRDAETNRDGLVANVLAAERFAQTLTLDYLRFLFAD